MDKLLEIKNCLSVETEVQRFVRESQVIVLNEFAKALYHLIQSTITKVTDANDETKM